MSELESALSALSAPVARRRATLSALAEALDDSARAPALLAQLRTFIELGDATTRRNLAVLCSDVQGVGPAMAELVAACTRGPAATMAWNAAASNLASTPSAAMDRLFELAAAELPLDAAYPFLQVGAADPELAQRTVPLLGGILAAGLDDELAANNLIAAAQAGADLGDVARAAKARLSKAGRATELVAEVYCRALLAPEAWDQLEALLTHRKPEVRRACGRVAHELAEQSLARAKERGDKEAMKAAFLVRRQLKSAG